MIRVRATEMVEDRQQQEEVLGTMRRIVALHFFLSPFRFSTDFCNIIWMIITTPSRPNLVHLVALVGPEFLHSLIKVIVGTPQYVQHPPAMTKFP